MGFTWDLCSIHHQKNDSLSSNAHRHVGESQLRSLHLPCNFQLSKCIYVAFSALLSTPQRTSPRIYGSPANGNRFDEAGAFALKHENCLCRSCEVRVRSWRANQRSPPVKSRSKTEPDGKVALNLDPLLTSVASSYTRYTLNEVSIAKSNIDNHQNPMTIAPETPPFQGSISGAPSNCPKLNSNTFEAEHYRAYWHTLQCLLTSEKGSSAVMFSSSLAALADVPTLTRRKWITLLGTLSDLGELDYPEYEGPDVQPFRKRRVIGE
ncbi:unnamed protein product [Periconia digitata]|uniref:Uncharacterized protein n=1 Tax=Periconia digitata TaxID=1303443 RepID=A0A9W4XMM9_9PLEO|nr:unnamed protein product [Periconia digitata]